MGTNLDIDEQLRILEPIFNGASVDSFKTRLEHAVTPVQSERIMRLVQKVVVQVNDEDTLRVDEVRTKTIFRFYLLLTIFSYYRLIFGCTQLTQQLENVKTSSQDNR